MKINEPFVLILSSGGVDSTSLIPYYQKMNYNIKLLWIDYGQQSRVMEQKAIKKLGLYFELNITIIQNRGYQPNLNNYEYQGRNLFLISTALLNFPLDYGLIALGIRENIRYDDCSLYFTQKANEIVEYLTSGRITIDIPLFNVSKIETLKYCFKNNVPIELTYSCDIGNNLPCNLCPSCLELNEAKGVVDYHEHI